MARKDLPWARLTMCPARMAMAGSWMPGAWIPLRYPRFTNMLGSLKMSQWEQRPEKCASGNVRVVGKAVGGITRGPATEILESLRQIKMVERGERTDAVGEQLVDDARVEVDAFLVGGSGAKGLDARPGERETIALDAERLHQRNVRFPEMKMVAGNVGSFRRL